MRTDPVRRWTAAPAVLVLVGALVLAAPVRVAGAAPGQPIERCPMPTAGTVIGGTAGDDVLTGTGGDDVIRAGEGDDVVDGGGGNDVIAGGGGVDVLQGGSGCDTLYGGDGADYLSGGDGIDTGYGGAEVNECDVEAAEDYEWIVSYFGTDYTYCSDTPL